MTRDQAIAILQRLAAAAELRRSNVDPSRTSMELVRMKYEAAATVASYLGAKHHLATSLSELPFSPKSIVFSPVGDSDGSVIDQFIGLLNASINLLSAPAEPTLPAQPACDPELWAYVEELVRIGAWDKIPGVVSTFVEGWYRTRGGDPKDSSGSRLHTRNLFKKVLTDLPLGSQAGESDGWLQLAMGFAGAIGNHYRHNAKVGDPDAERLAWGVIGVGSLLITEMKRTHPPV